MLSCSADEVPFDMTSITGGEPERVSAQRIVEGWDEGLRALKAIHHQVGNHIVRMQGGEADLFCLHLEKVRGTWRIDRFAFHLKFVEADGRIWPWKHQCR